VNHDTRGPRPETVFVIIGVLPELWAELLTRALSTESGMEVLGRAAQEDEILSLATACVSAVALLDYEAMGPGVEGMIARMRRVLPSLKILVLARRFSEETARAVLRAGAAGLVGKHMDCATLATALRSIAKGEVWANRQVTAQVIQQLTTASRGEPEELPPLTRREWEVVDSVGRGQRNKEIALSLGISEKTVKTHLNNIFVKTRLRGRFALALWAQGAVGPKS